MLTNTDVVMTAIALPVPSYRQANKSTLKISKEQDFHFEKQKSSKQTPTVGYLLSFKSEYFGTLSRV